MRRMNRSEEFGVGTGDGTQPVELVTATCRVQEVVERHPGTVIILNRHGMHCAGCYISPYHTIADCAREYAIPLDSLLTDLNQAV
jgi:hybrid cluster-associated redox disulfide protein